METVGDLMAWGAKLQWQALRCMQLIYARWKVPIGLVGHLQNLMTRRAECS
jgi:hypothetical protein